MWPTPACLIVRATRCPPFRSGMVSFSSRARGPRSVEPVKAQEFDLLARLVSPSAPRRNVDDLELETVGVLEEHRVVSRCVLRELARGVVERRDASRRHELLAEPVHVLAPIDTECEVIQAQTLAVESPPYEARRSRDQPDVHAAVGERGHVALVVNHPPREVPEEVPIEEPGTFRRAHVDLQVV